MSHDDTPERMAELIRGGDAVLLCRTMDDLPAEAVDFVTASGSSGSLLWCGVPLVIANGAERRLLAAMGLTVALVGREQSGARAGFGLTRESAAPTVGTASRAARVRYRRCRSGIVLAEPEPGSITQRQEERDGT